MPISVSGKEWKFPVEIQLDRKLIETAGGDELLAKILVRRGIRTSAEAAIFLDPSCYKPSSPGELPDMQAAVTRISAAIDGGEQITVFGDYDVDGVTATAVLVTVLRRLGAAVDYYIPNRISEGYGLNLKAVSIIASKRRTKLLISCDCGVSNFAEINFAKSLGLDTIVVDHHTMPELMPPAVAVLHPKLLSEDHPLYHLPGVGVAYKLAEALLLSYGYEDEVPSLHDFVTLGMIADLVPLVKENRYLVQIGLPALVHSRRPGIRALLTQVGGMNGTDVVGFGLAPRINAVGRLADANVAVELMTTANEEIADKLAHQMQSENSRRQELCDAIFSDVEQEIARGANLKSDRAIALCKAGWHHGVVGIVASRLVEKYHRPVFLGELDEEAGTVKGSARGVEGIDLFEVLKANEHLLLKWGGHKMAAGFSVEAERADVLLRALVETCNRMLHDKPLTPTLDIDIMVAPGDVTFNVIQTLSKLAPFGMANKKPVLVMKELCCDSTRSLGKEGKHTRIALRDPVSAATFEAVFWNSKDKVPAPGQLMDVAFFPEVNSYNGKDRLQLVISDWRDAHGAQDVSPAPSNIAVPAVPAVSQFVAETAAVLPDQSQPVPIERRSATASARHGAGAQAGASGGTRDSKLAAVSQVWKDLRGHHSPDEVLSTAVRKLGERLTVFGESCARPPSIHLSDRLSCQPSGHLLIWQYPPSLNVLQSLVQHAAITNVYLLGAGGGDSDEPEGFLRRLFGLVRFAVNQRDGKTEGERLCAAMGSTKMCVALGLAILRRINMIDWFAEDGVVYLDIIGEPSSRPQDTPEYKQLVDSLHDIAVFRQWCAATDIKEIQCSVLPNNVQLAGQGPSFRSAIADEPPSRAEQDTVESSPAFSD